MSPRRSVAVEQMVAVRRVQLQVVGAVVGAVAIAVVDAFLRRKSAAKDVLHHEAMFHDVPVGAVLPDLASDVSLWGDLSSDEIGAMWTRAQVQACQTTCVGAEPGGTVAESHDLATFTHSTGDRHRLVAGRSLPSDGTGLATRRESPSSMGLDAEQAAAGDALLGNHASIVPRSGTRHVHLENGWATSHRPELRDYLRGVTA